MLGRILLTLVASVGLISIAVAEKLQLDIPAQDLSASLTQFGRETGTEIVFAPDTVRAKRAIALKGQFERGQALKLLLEGSGLTYRTTAQGAIIVERSHTRISEVGKESSALALPRSDSEAAEGDSQHFDESAKSTPSRKAMPEILVKGSRTMNVDVVRTENDAQPYYVFDSARIAQSGAASIEDFLKQRLTMNAAFSSNSQQFGNPLGSTSSINLRGLGSTETLILVDGRRTASVNFIGNAGQPDINGIPLAAIERIEVLPSSAAAIYGGAALGGVVNVVLKKRFQGGQIDTRYENTASGNAPLKNIGATYGFSLGSGKTQVMISGHYSDGETLFLRDRVDLSQRGVSAILRNSPALLYDAYNPFAGATPNISGMDENFSPTNLVLKDGTPLNSGITSIAPGAAPGSNLDAALLARAGAYNLNPSNGTGIYGLQIPIGSVPRASSVMATLRQEITETISAFAEYSTTSNATRSRYNPFGRGYTIPATAPDNPFLQSVIISLPTAVSGPLVTDSDMRRTTFGVLAQLPYGWNSELDYTWSKSSLAFVQYFEDSSALSAALADGSVNPFVDTIAHPLNLAPYLVPAAFDGGSTLNDVGLRASGPVGHLPWGDPQVTIGLEHRKEGSLDSHQVLTYALDPTRNSDMLYFGQSQSTNSIYIEAQVPLVTANNAIPLVRLLELQLAGRSERYTVHANTLSKTVSPVAYQFLDPPQGVSSTIEYTSTNPTLALRYRPVEEVTLRASYAKAFLPPTALQFLPNTRPTCGFPCAPVIDPSNGSVYNVDESFGGNPRLEPQTSRSWNFGVIFQPREGPLANFRLDLERYDIVQPNYIAYPDVQQVVNDPRYANRVTRDPTSGLITLVNLSPVNATQFKTAGWDFKLDYTLATAVGTFDFSALGTVIDYEKRQYAIGAPQVDYAGFPSETGEGKVKANASINWSLRRFNVAWSTTYFGSYGQTGAPGSPSAVQYGPNPAFTDAQGGFRIPSQVYHDIYASYAFDGDPSNEHRGSRLLSNLTLQFSVKNIFNTLPPFDAASSPYYYSPNGDPRLRDYWVGLRKEF